MDGRSPERGSSRGPEDGPAPQTRKTRRELRAEREAAERARTGEQPTQPGQPGPPVSGTGPAAAPSGSWFDQPGPGPARPSPRGEGARRSGSSGRSTGADRSGPFDRPGPGPADRFRPAAPGEDEEPGRFDQGDPVAAKRPGLMDRPSLKDRANARRLGRGGAGPTAPRPWDQPDPPERRPPERPERGPLDERVPKRPTPLGGMPMGQTDPRGQALSRNETRPPLREAALRSDGVPAAPVSRRDRSSRLRPSPAEEDDYRDHPDPEDDDFDPDDPDGPENFEDFEDEEPEPEAKAVDPRKRRRTAIWLFAVSLLLALWSATMFIDSASPLVTVPSALIPLVTIGALPVIAIGVGGKHFVPTGIAALAALLPWAMVAGYASSRDAPVGKIATVRVLAVEGAHGRADADSIAQAAQEYSADVVIITGLNTTLAHDLTVAGLDDQAPVQGVVRVEGEGSNGIGIWSRLAVSELTELPDFAKPAASAVLEAGTAQVGMTIAQLPGGTLRPGPGWRKDLDRLAQHEVPAAKTGSFLVGDLNAAPWQPAFRSLEKAGWEDAADVAGKGLRPTWPAWSPLPVTPADHLLVDQGIGVTSAATVDIAGSSHRALVVSLEIPTS